MTEMEILGYLITFLETFQFCCVTIYGLRREDMTLKEISKILEVSESRISQLHTKALNKMRKKMGVYMNILTE